MMQVYSERYGLSKTPDIHEIPAFDDTVYDAKGNPIGKMEAPH